MSFRPFLLLSVAALALAPAAARPAPDPPPAAEGAAPVLSRQDVEVLLAMLRGAPAHGFGQDEFTPGAAETQIASADPAVRTAAEAKLESLAVAYAAAQHGQRIAAISP